MESEYKDIRQFVLEVAAAALMCAALIMGLFIVSRDPDAYGAASIIKMHRLAFAPAKRVIFVGGSGLAFGVDSPKIEAMSGLHPVNMGLYAGFGIDYLLAQARSGARPGDTIVLVPEYDILTTPPNANGFLVLEATQALPRNFSFATGNVASLVAVARSFPTWISTRAVSLAGRIASPLIGRSDTLYHRVYRAGAFNTYGDNTGASSETYRLTAAEIASSSAEVLERPLNEETLAHIEAFIAMAERNGVQVYIAWPALPRSLEARAHETLVQNEARMRTRFGAHVLGTQAQFVFDDSAFFDTINHLAPEEKVLRSERLGSLLRNVR